MYLIPRSELRHINRKLSHYIVSYIKSGSCRMRIAGKDYYARQGDVVFIPPYELHDHVKHGFGLHGWSVILPQALAGVGSVILIYVIVKPTYGVIAARIGALVMALTPVLPAVSRTNNIDSYRAQHSSSFFGMEL